MSGQQYEVAYLKQCIVCGYVYTAKMEDANCPRCGGGYTRVICKFLEVAMSGV